MYLYLGQNTVINSKKIIGIFDLDNTTVSKITKDFLNNAQKKSIIINTNEELPKSFIVCDKNGKSKIYLSQISPATLKKRTNSYKKLKD